MTMHEHAPCIKDPVTLHLLADRGLLTSDTNSALHSAEGCGDCPGKMLGSCALLNSIGADQITQEQRRAIIEILTA